MADEAVPSVQQMLGVPSEIPVGKDVWRFGPPNQAAKAILEDLIAAEAVNSVVRLKAVLDPATYQEHVTAVMRRIDAKDYATGGPGWLTMVQSPVGHMFFLLSLFRVNHPAMTIDEAEKVSEAVPEAVSAALVRQVPDFFKMVFPKVPADILDPLVASVVANMEASLRPPSPSGESPPSGTVA
jgi:hypothetical protein